MLAVVIDKYGSADVMRVGEVPVPVPRRRDVLVRVRAAAINPADWKMRQGNPMSGKLHSPVVIGLDLAGDVVSAGPEATRFKAGDAVFGFLPITRPGSYAQFAAVPERALALKPAKTTYAEAASMPVAATTAVLALRDKGHVHAGSRVLILGASGGVGTAAVQIGKILGAHVTGVCSGKNAELVKSLGCDRVVDYKQQDPKKLEERFDVILNAATYEYSDCKHLLASPGVFVTITPSLSALVPVLLGLLPLRKRAKMFLASPRQDIIQDVASWLEAGKLRPIIEKVYPAAEAVQAHKDSEAGRARGKLVLDIESFGKAASASA